MPTEKTAYYWVMPEEISSYIEKKFGIHHKSWADILDSFVADELKDYDDATYKYFENEIKKNKKAGKDKTIVNIRQIDSALNLAIPYGAPLKSNEPRLFDLLCLFAYREKGKTFLQVLKDNNISPEQVYKQHGVLTTETSIRLKECGFDNIIYLERYPQSALGMGPNSQQGIPAPDMHKGNRYVKFILSIFIIISGTLLGLSVMINLIYRNSPIVEYDLKFSNKEHNLKCSLTNLTTDRSFINLKFDIKNYPNTERVKFPCGGYLTPVPPASQSNFLMPIDTNKANNVIFVEIDRMNPMDRFDVGIPFDGVFEEAVIMPNPLPEKNRSPVVLQKSGLVTFFIKNKSMILISIFTTVITYLIYKKYNK